MTAPRPPLKPSDLWLTPPWLLDLVERVDEIALDPCAGPSGWTRAREEFRLDRGEDGLVEPWQKVRGLAFVNPPYGPGHLPLWGSKIRKEAERGAEVIALLPATPSPEWFQTLAPASQAILFLCGRPRFHDPVTLQESDGPGTKDSALLYFGDRARRFLRAFEGRGMAVRP